MSITITVTGDADTVLADLQSLLRTASTAAKEDAAVEDPKPAPAKRGRKPKAKDEPAPEPKEEAPAEKAPEAKSEPEPDTQERDLGEVQTKLRELVEKEGLEKAAEVLSEFKAGKMSDVSKAQYGEVYDRIVEVLGE